MNSGGRLAGRGPAGRTLQRRSSGRRRTRPARLAAIAFADQESLQALQRHRALRSGRDAASNTAACVGTDRIVVMDIPLLAEHPRDRTSPR
ncbi:MAG: hypothetical protein R2705_25150 [Ilumatobacteraceae bacterium]